MNGCMEGGDELLLHKHEWIVLEEAFDPVDTASRPKKALSNGHGHGHVKKISIGNKH